WTGRHSRSRLLLAGPRQRLQVPVDLTQDVARGRQSAITDHLRRPAYVAARARQGCRRVAAASAWPYTAATRRNGEDQIRASRIRLKGVSAARRKRVSPPSRATLRSLASPACAPSARPTSWSSEAGVQIMVDAA